MDAAELPMAFRLLQLFPLPGDRHLDTGQAVWGAQPAEEGLSSPDEMPLAGHRQPG